MIQRRFFFGGLHFVFLVILALGFSTCQDNIMDDDPCYNIFNLSLKDESGVDEVLSDVCVLDPTRTFCLLVNDPVILTVENLPKTTSLIPSDAMDVVITKYQVYFIRRDEGTEVPPSISHRVSWWVPIDETQTFSFSIVTHEQKALPPLDDLRVNGYDWETGNISIETDARVIFSGHTRTGCKIAFEASIPVKFSDFAD